MKHSFAAALIAVALATSCGAFAQGNINQSQSGSGNNQSISIGNTDDKPVKKSKSKKSVQKDDSGNVQSSNVSGSTGGDVNQSQKGSSNKQSLSIGGNSGGKLPTVNQSQPREGPSSSICAGGCP